MNESGKEWKKAGSLLGLFVFCYFMPLEVPRLHQALGEGLGLLRWYAREHVLLCLIPAFFLAGAITIFLQREAVMNYLAARASKPVAHGVASVSGGVLAAAEKLGASYEIEKITDLG